MASFTTLLAEIVASEGEGLVNEKHLPPYPLYSMFKPVIQNWLVWHDRCGVCEDSEGSMGMFDLKK